ncbi:MAG: hypothetical protein LC114_16995 [Bryobacterales bacterium]|nr:hypothetical protein [Bryobacterales bacterium]
MAQSVRVGTEFARYTPEGMPFPQEGVSSPVEVLSPPLVRGMWNSFRILVEVEAETVFRLFVAQNPEYAMQVRIFREVVANDASGWKIVRRESAPLPFRSTLIPVTERTPNQTVYTFWLDVRPPQNYPSERLKLEAQILVKGQWFIYPMEIRVVDLTLSSFPPGQADLPVATLGTRTADLPYREVLHRFVCAAPGEQGSTILVEANYGSALEGYAARSFDFVLDALARKEGRDSVLSVIAMFLGYQDPAAWCAAPDYRYRTYGAEWPAVLRNRLLRMTGNPY